MLKKNKGFTLLELLVVLAIIGLLIAIAVPHFIGILDRARDTAIQAELVGAQSAAERFRDVEGSFDGFCAGSADWHKIRDTIINEHNIPSNRIHCIDSAHFFAISSGLHTTDAYWVVDAGGRDNPGASVKGLVGYWRFHEGRGDTARDASGLNNHGILHGNPTWKFNAIYLDGIGDFINIPNSPSLSEGAIRDAITVETWLKAGAPTYVHVWQVISKYNSFILGAHTASVCFITCEEDICWGTHRPCVSIANPAEWNHVVGTWDINTGYRKIYVNGVLRGTEPNIDSRMRLDTGPLHLGQRECCPGQVFHGYLDETRIYNRALSADEIKAQFEEGKWRR